MQCRTIFCRCLWRTDNLQALAAQRIVNVDHGVCASLCQKVHQLHAGKPVLVHLWCTSPYAAGRLYNAGWRAPQNEKSTCNIMLAIQWISTGVSHGRERLPQPSLHESIPEASPHCHLQSSWALHLSAGIADLGVQRLHVGGAECRGHRLAHGLPSLACGACEQRVVPARRSKLRQHRYGQSVRILIDDLSAPAAPVGRCMVARQRRVAQQQRQQHLLLLPPRTIYQC